MRKAIELPTEINAKDYLNQGVDILERMILIRGKDDSYAFHLIGSQGLSWARRASLIPQERISFLQQLLTRVDEGVGLHPMDRDLARLRLHP